MVHPVKNKLAAFLDGKAIEAPDALSKMVGISPNYLQRINRHHWLFSSLAMLVAALLQTKTYGNHQQGNSKTTRQEFSSQAINRCPVARMAATFQPQKRNASYSVMRKGTHKPIGVSTLPSDPS
jgi:hypothetical protein